MRLRGHSYKTKQFFFALIKLCVVLLAFYVIYIKLVKNADIEMYDFLNHVYSTDLLSFKTVVLLLLLSAVNWILEISKWKVLVKHLKPISFFQAAQESLGALTASIITPNRIGEYAAKAIFYSSYERPRIVFLNFIGNMTQMLATVLFGLWGLFKLRAVLGWTFSPDIQLIYGLLAAFGFAAVWIFCKGRYIKVKGYSIMRLFKFLKHVDRSILFTSQVLAILRYLIFSLQMVLLFKFFAVDLSYFELMPIIASMYLLSSVLPSLFVFDVIIKGSIAVYLFAYFGISEVTTFSVILLMWLCNLVVPSVMGSYVVLNFKPIQQTA